MSNYIVRAVAGNVPKGNGLFATRNIKAGETIIEEEAILELNWRTPDRAFFKSEYHGDTAMVQPALDSLETQEQRNDFLALYHDQDRVAGTAGWTANLDRFFVNRFEHHNDDGSILMAVLKDIARANNSCVPNAYFYFGERKRGAIRAVKDVSRGEEITIHYLAGGWMTRSERAKPTGDWTYDCKACIDYTDDPEKHAFFEASDARRQELETLRALLQQYYPSEETSGHKFRDLCDAIEQEGRFWAAPLNHRSRYSRRQKDTVR